ncbi:MAG: 5-formyltetrahydrofolate cyclo-ligase [Ruminococcus sp.]|nr:5-formyltetrahydrofolate cyclo-ligase [Ruminococcus sp.]
MSLKGQLRFESKKLRTEMSKSQKALLDKRLTERFLSFEGYKNAGTVFAFVSLSIEVDTEEIIRDALVSGKRLAVPRCNVNDGTMTFYYIKSRGDLKKGYFGLLEPDEKKCERALKRDCDLIIVPGLVFDKSGHRIGFGKGYYDRYLRNFEGVSAGVCYSFCVKQRLPKEKFDLPVKYLITDNYIETCSGKGMKNG